MRILKVAAITVGGLVGVLVVLLVAVRLSIDPNAYKGRIARAVKESTGRELALPGNIKLSVFPWIALEFGPATLGNLPGFGDEPFAAVKHAALRVRLIPLLRKQLEIGRVEVEGLDLRLRKDATGRGNWRSASQTSAPSQPSEGAGAAALRDLAGIVISDSRFSYQDMVAEHVNLTVGRVADGVEIPIKVKLDLTRAVGTQPIGMAGEFRLTIDTDHGYYKFSPMDLDGTVSPATGASPVPWKFSAPEVDLNLEAQTLSAEAVTARLGAAHLSASLHGSKLVDAPGFAGSFKLNPLSPRELMTEFGIAAPKTRDVKALSKLAATGEFAYAGKRLGLSKLDVQLDDSRLRGSAAIIDLDTKAMEFDLALNQIDIDRYRSPPGNAPTAVAPAPGKSGEVPVDPLKTLEMNGTFALGSATFAGLRVTDGFVKLQARAGLAHIAPLTAKLYGGQYSGDVTLDARGPVLSSKFQQNLAGVDVAQLLKDFAKSQRLSGRGTITSTLTARGSGADAVLKSLNGRVAANLGNGAIEGVDLGFEVNRAMALIRKQAAPSGSSTGRTKFESFKASADIVDGVATTKDLDVASQNLRITGQGTANLVTEVVDYRVQAKLLKAAPMAASAPGGPGTLADIPLSITGTMGSPVVRPDLEGLAKSQVQQQLNKHKQELQQKLQDQLKNLLR